MPKTTRGVRPVTLLAVTTAVLLLTACNRLRQKGPQAPASQLQLKPAAAARAKLVAEIVFPSIEGTLANVRAVATKLNLPFASAIDLKALLTSRANLSPSVLEHVDLSRPAAMVMFMSTRKGATAETAEGVAVFQTKTSIAAAGGLAKLAAGIGQLIETSGDAVHLRAGDAGGPASGKDAWLLERDGVVCAGEALDHLVDGCGLALEERKGGGQDLRVVLIPEGLARASGTTLKDALTKARQQLAAQQARAQTMTGGDPQMQAHANKLAESMASWIFDSVADTAEARINLALDDSKGLSAGFEVLPRAGTALARTVAARHPYEVHPALAGGAPGALWTMGDTTFSRTIFQSMRAPLLELITPEAERTKAGAAMDALMDAISGPFSGRFAFEEGPKLSVAYDVVYTLKPGTDGKKLLGDLESMLKAPWLGKLLDVAFQGMMKIKLATKRDGAALVVQATADTRKLPKEMKAQVKWMPLFDGAPLETRTVIAGDKLMVSMGAGTKARLAALVAGSGTPPSGELATALAESKGADALYYADFAAILKPLFTLAATGAIGVKGSPDNMRATATGKQLAPVLATAHLALWGTYRGGDVASIGGRIPIGTLQSVAPLFVGVLASP